MSTGFLSAITFWKFQQKLYWIFNCDFWSWPLCTFTDRISQTHKDETVWCIQWNQEVITELIAFYFIHFHWVERKLSEYELNEYFLFLLCIQLPKLLTQHLIGSLIFEQDKSSDIEHQPPFVNCIKSNTLPQMRKGATKPTGTSYLRSLILFHNYCGSGADPGIFVRGGGPTIWNFLKSKKKKKQDKKGRGRAASVSILL